MTNTEIQQLLDQAVATLKLTTVGYAGHSIAWQNNTTTNWWKGLDAIGRARAALNPPPPPPPPVTSPARFFADTAWPNAHAQDHWNPLPYSTQVRDLFAADAAKTSGVFCNGLAGLGGAWSTTVYYQRDATTTRTIHDNVNNIDDTVPWNPAWKPSPDSDAHISIVFNDDRYYETEGLDQPWAGGYGHTAGAAWGTVTGDAIPVPKTRHVAGAPTIAGLVMAADVAAGVIPHATKGATISTGTVNGISSVYPSWGNDGNHNPGIPMGTWFALPASFDTTRYTGPVRMVADAWKTYGHYITDTGGSCSMQAQSTAQGVTYPFSSLTVPTEIVQQLVALAPLQPAY